MHTHGFFHQRRRTITDAERKIASDIMNSGMPANDCLSGFICQARFAKSLPVIKTNLVSISCFRTPLRYHRADIFKQ
jgi:hypothetical protein